MENIAAYIDHTLLKPDASSEEIVKICKDAIKHNFASVCVNPYYVKLAKRQLKDSEVKICSVVGFPLGCTMKEVKACETELAIQHGADEIDMVINISALKNKDYNTVKEDIEAVVEKARDNAIVKVIIETCLLTEKEKVKACLLSVDAGADFVKTSTGFSTGGAVVSDVKLMKKTVGNRAKIKASGGIRDINKAYEFIDAGADRIGASLSVAIVESQNN